MYANEVEKKKISWDKKNNYNINIIYEPFIANEIKAREKHYTQSQAFLQNPRKYKALLKTFHLNGGIIKDCPQIESLLMFLKKQANKQKHKEQQSLLWQLLFHQRWKNIQPGSLKSNLKSYWFPY